jgi:hypothetical protein
MIRNLKMLGVAFATVMALSAVVASAASATPEFTASSYPATATGSNTKGSEVFTTEGGKVECDSHFVTNSLSEASSIITVTPTYTSCDAFGFLEATVNMEGCRFPFTMTKVLSLQFTLDIHIECPAGKSIKITASTCKVEIKGQTALEKVTATNSGGSVVVKPAVEKIAYTVTQDGFLCPFSGTGNKTGGTYTGEVTMSRVGGGSVSVS